MINRALEQFFRVSAQNNLSLIANAKSLLESHGQNIGWKRHSKKFSRG